MSLPMPSTSATLATSEPRRRPPFKQRLIMALALASYLLPFLLLVEIGAWAKTGQWHLFAAIPPHGLVALTLLLTLFDAAVGLVSLKPRVKSLLPKPETDIDVLHVTVHQTAIWLGALGVIEALIYWAEQRLFFLAMLSPWTLIAGAAALSLYGALWQKAAVALQRAWLRRGLEGNPTTDALPDSYRQARR